jgi:taurine--2-oxoglutarate transaminase
MTTVPGSETSTEKYKRLTREHVLVSWSAQRGIDQPVIVGGEGCWLWDADGRRILDFSSQLVNSNIGHQHPKVVEAIKRQAERLTYVGPNFGNDVRAELAARLARVTPGDLCKTLFTTGGAEANENAIKMARLVTGRHKIITRYRSFHGATFGAMTAGGDNRRWANEPGIPGIVRVLDPYCYRCPFGHRGRSPENCCMQGLDHIEEVIWNEGPDHIAAIMVEGLTGTNGIIVPPDGYMQGLRELCDRYGMLLIVDEVMSGFGRTGKWFAVDHWNVVPDIMTFAKGITSGYVPLGGAIVNQRVANYFEDHVLWGGLTYSGHPLACAAGLATLEVYEEERLIERSAEMGQFLLEELRKLADKHPSVGDVRGKGLFCAIELVKDRETREMLVRWNSPSQGVMNEIKRGLMDRGVYVFCKWNILFVAPPLVISPDEIRIGVQAIDEVLDIADRAAGV